MNPGGESKGGRSHSPLPQSDKDEPDLHRSLRSPRLAREQNDVQAIVLLLAPWILER